MYAFHACTAQEVDSVGKSVKVVEHYAPDAGLYDEFRTLQTWRGCNVERRAVTRIIAPGYFSNGVCFGVEYVRLGRACIVFAHVFKSGGRAVEAVGDYHIVFYQQATHFTALAI